MQAKRKVVLLLVDAGLVYAVTTKTKCTGSRALMLVLLPHVSFLCGFLRQIPPFVPLEAPAPLFFESTTMKVAYPGGGCAGPGLEKLRKSAQNCTETCAKLGKIVAN